jgi:Flp pilus assembly protein TadG
MRRLCSFLRDTRGATLVETTLVFPMVLILTFGLVEFGVAFWEYHAAEKATNLAARYIATRGPLVATLADGSHDCFVDNGVNGVAIGVSCADPSVSTASGPYICKGNAPGSCSATVLAAAITQMRQVAPFITNANVEVDVAQSKMGYIGRGKAVPLVTVKTTGLTYTFVAMDNLLGFAPLTMPGFATTLEAEDQQEGPGS